mmetsp:Transcript_26876/g.50320  ORF Transcript_26876/g.50320 Transcript_26876/m.50320 type:complete len:173 (-) Transcript_26876:160-678(-)
MLATQQQKLALSARRASVWISTFLLLLVLCDWSSSVRAFVVVPQSPSSRTAATSRIGVETAEAAGSGSSQAENDPNEIVARRIVVTGDVQGGYYRSCVLNEAGRFRRLTGTMTPPDDSNTAEIYVEGKRKQVDGFLRWCRKGDVGLSQVVTVAEVIEAEPTGLYDGFYCKTR